MARIIRLLVERMDIGMGGADERPKLDGQQAETMTLPGLMEPFPVEWKMLGSDGSVLALCRAKSLPA